MKIFEKRPLSLILCIMLAVFSLFIEGSITVKLILLFVCLFLFLLTFISKLFSVDKLSFIRASTVAASLALIISIAWSGNFYHDEVLGDDKIIEGTITDVQESLEYSKLTVKTDKICEQKTALKLSLYYYYNDVPEIGDKISFKSTLSDIKAYVGKDSYSYYYSDGISVIATNVSDIDITEGNDFSLDKLLRSVRNNISITLQKRTNNETGGFLAALLIGDQTNLDPSTSLSFRRLGISHILALSGMHLAILTHAIERILTLLRIHKKIRVLSSSIFIITYMAIVGFTPSITRSGIMLLIYYLLFLISRRHDSITSLFIAVSVIVFTSPTSVFDISLWLSAFATLGVIISSSFIDKKAHNRNVFIRALLYCLHSLISSFFAISCTLVFSVTVFGSVSVISVFTTLIFSFSIELLIYLGFCLLLFGGLLPFGKPIVLLADSIKELADKMSSPAWVLASSDYPAVKVVTALFTAFLFLFLVLNIKRRKNAVAALAVAFTSIFLISGISTAVDRSTDAIYTDVAKSSDTILIKSDSKIYVIYNEDPSVSNSYHILNLLNKERLMYLDELVLTSISNDSASSLGPLVNNLRVGIIRVPVPKTEYEFNSCQELAGTLSKHGTTLRFYDKELELGECQYELLYRTAYMQNSPSESVYILSSKGISCAYLTSNAHNIAPISALKRIDECEIIILGLGGAAKEHFDLRFNKTEYIIVNGSAKISEDAEDYYSEHSATVYYNKSRKSIFE